MGAEIKGQTLCGGGALERGHGASLEPLAQLGDALGGVAAVAPAVDAAELAAGQAATENRRFNEQTLVGWLPTESWAPLCGGGN